MKNFLEQIKTFMLSEAFSGVSWWVVITVAVVIALALILTAIVVSSKKRKKAKQNVANENNEIVNASECSECSNDTLTNEVISEDKSTSLENIENENIENTTCLMTEEENKINEVIEVEENTTCEDCNNENVVLEECTENNECSECKDNENVKPVAEVIENDTIIEEDKAEETLSEDATNKVDSDIVENEDNVEKPKTKTKQTSFKINAKNVQRKVPITSISEEKQASFGKYVIIKKENEPFRPYCFRLLANNGQLLFESELYKVKPKKNSIDAFKRSASKRENFVVDDDKNNTFRYKLYNNNGNMIGVGETYSSRQSCISAVESVMRFAQSATIVEDLTVEKQENDANKEENKE